MDNRERGGEARRFEQSIRLCGWALSVCLGVVACGGNGARRARSASVTLPAVQLAITADCQRAQQLETQSDQALADGNRLRARRLATQAHEKCPSATRALARVRVLLDSPSRTVNELLSDARRARDSGHEREAREAEAAAVVALERAGEHLRIRPRWSFETPVLSRGGRYVFLPDEEQLLVLDTWTGEQKMRVPRPQGDPLPFEESNFEGELKLSADKLVLRTERMGNNSYSIGIYDGQAGSLLSQSSATDWLFSADGARLALAEVGPFDTAPVNSSVVLLDARSLQPIERIISPDPSSDWRGFTAMALEPTSNSLAIAWRNGLTLVELGSGRVAQFQSTTQSAYLPTLAVGAGLAVWRAGSEVLVSSSTKHGLWRLALPHCSYGHTAVSPDGARLAVSCPDAVTVWDTVTHRLLTRTPGVTASDGMTWLAGGRGLGLRGSPSVVSAMKVLDTVTHKLVTLAAAEEDWQVSPELRLATVAHTPGPNQLVYLDTNLRPQLIPVPECSTLLAGVTAAGNGVGIVSCLTAHGLNAVVIDTRTLSTRSFPIGSDELAVENDELIGLSKHGVELRALGSGALLSFSPRSPRQLIDGFWNRDTLVVGIDTEPAMGRLPHTRPNTLITSHFGATLSAQSAPVSLSGPCAGPSARHRATFSWSVEPPFALCDRRSGDRVGTLPPLANGGRADPDVSDDGELVLTDKNQPRLFVRRTGQELSLAEPPLLAQFAGARLLVGYDATASGVWSAETGKRLARWSGIQAVSPVAADTQLGIAVLAHSYNTPVTLLDLWSGAQLETLPVAAQGDVQFVSPGVLSVAEATEVSFWRVPKARRLGRWLVHPGGGDVAFLADSGELELSGSAMTWQNVLRCEVGRTELPLQTCIDALLEPTIAARTLGLPPSGR